MAKVIVKREKLIGGAAVKHNVYLNNRFLGILKNGGVLSFEAPVGSHTLYFNSCSGLNKRSADSEFQIVVNNSQETIEILTKFNFSGKYVVEYADNAPHIPSYTVEDNKGICCPVCGNSELTPISETYTSGNDFNASNAFCGYLLCGPIGLLFGTDKKGKQQHTDHYWVCKKCGNKFKM